MKILTNKITTITLGALCLIMIPVIIILAGNVSSANDRLDPVMTELEHTQGLLEYERGLVAWYKESQRASSVKTASMVQELHNRIAGLEQEKADTYQASLIAYNSQIASYNALLAERDDLSGKLAEALTRSQKVNIVEVEKYVYLDLQDWRSVEELKAFLAEDNTDTVLKFTGNVTFNSSCEERAFQLRKRAFDIGKRLEMEILTPAEYKKWYGDTIASDSLHAICKAVIGNEVWYIEPADDRHWIGAYLD